MISSEQLVRAIRLTVVTRRVLDRARATSSPRPRTAWLRMSKVIEAWECPSISEMIYG